MFFLKFNQIFLQLLLGIVGILVISPALLAQSEYNSSLKRILQVLDSAATRTNTQTTHTPLQFIYQELIRKQGSEHTRIILERVAQLLVKSGEEAKLVIIIHFWLHACKYNFIKKKENLAIMRKKLLDYAQSIKNDYYKINIYTFLANLHAFSEVSNYVLAKEYFEKALKMAKESGSPSIAKHIPHLYSNIGLNIYEKIGDYSLALAYKYRAFATADSLKLSPLQVATYKDALARLHYKVQNNEKAYRIWQSNLLIYLSIGDKTRNIIQNYNNLALAKRAMMQIDSAIFWFNKAYQVAYQQKDTLWQGIVKGNIGISYLKNKQYTQAVPLILYDIQQSLQYKEYANAIISASYAGDAFLGMKDYVQARKYYDTTLQLLKQYQEWITDYQPQADLHIRSNTFYGLARLEAVLGNFERAYHYMTLYKEQQEQQKSMQEKANLALMQANYDFQKIEQQQQAQMLEQKNLLNVVSLVGLIVLLSAFFVYFYYQSKYKQKYLEAKCLQTDNILERERNLRLSQDIVFKETVIKNTILDLEEKNKFLREMEQDLKKLQQNEGLTP